MTYSDLELANEIKRKISKLQDLRRATFKPYLHFLPFKIRWSGICVQDDNGIVICDEGLNKLIEEYCDKRIAELQAELETL